MNSPFKRAHRTASVRAAFPVTLAIAVVVGLVGASGAFAAGGTVGTYEVQVASGGTWTTVGSAAFGFGYTTESVELPGAFQQVRLVQHGGEASQIDGVSLGGTAPMAVTGSSDGSALSKMVAVDNDVTNVFDQAVILTFPVAGASLDINARIQGDISGMFPLEFPQANTFTSVGPGSAFYSYRLGGLPTAIDTDAKPVLAEFRRPDTGHPAGTTYVWLADDGANLRATLDFTPDNTEDDGEDYAAVHVKTPAGVKEFKVSTAQKTWGDVAFTSTDKAGYQHKLYTFTIPWSAIGTVGDTVDVAFTAYGTAAVGRPVYRFYNKAKDNHFYTIDAAEKDAVIATLADTYVFEGVAYNVAPSFPNVDPLYRFYSPKLGSHFYTVSQAERDRVIATLGETYTYEGIAYDVCLPEVFGTLNIYRFYNLKNGSHFYTASVAERDLVLADPSGTYAYEGVGFHVFQ